MSRPRVRYVCLSDLHLGDKDSLLTRPRDDDSEPQRVSAVFDQLLRCLATVVDPHDRPILIVNGDFLDLAFGTVADALTIFEHAASRLRSAGLFARFVYLPGNHDHHLWEIARSTQYRETVLSAHHADGLPRMAHSTPPTLEGAVPATLLNDMLGHLDPPPGPGQFRDVEVVYPNLVLHEGDRAVIIHHGHFVESLYRLFSSGRRWLFPERPAATTVDDIEAENFAWIEFVWSLMGRSGGAGHDVENLFEMLRYPDRVKAFIRGLAHRTAPSLRIPLVPFTALRRVVLRLVFARMARALSGERTRLAQTCSPEVMRGIRAYLFGPSFTQLRELLGHVPSDVTFVFGHTHKPFERSLRDDDEGRVDAINSGGWTVDNSDPTPRFGASIVLIGESLESVALRVYNDMEGGGPEALTVRAPSGAEGPLARHLRARLAEADTRTEWAELGRLAEEATAVIRARHKDRYGR